METYLEKIQRLNKSRGSFAGGTNKIDQGIYKEACRDS